MVAMSTAYIHHRGWGGGGGGGGGVGHRVLDWSCPCSLALQFGSSVSADDDSGSRIPSDSFTCSVAPPYAPLMSL